MFRNLDITYTSILFVYVVRLLLTLMLLEKLDFTCLRCRHGV